MRHWPFKLVTLNADWYETIDPFVERLGSRSYQTSQFFLFGYPVEAIGKGQKKRKPLSEIAHRERWNQPFV